MKQEENDIFKSAKNGAKYDGTLGVGFGAGLGVFYYTSERVVAPVVRAFYSNWGISGLTTLRYTSLPKSVSAFSLTTGIALALAGGVGGSIHGFFKASTSKDVKQDNELTDRHNPGF